MLPTSAVAFACLSVMLLPARTLSNPYGYYGPYSRTRRDPAAWEQGYGGMVQQNQPLPVVPNVRGNLQPSYGNTMDAQGVGMGGQYAAKDHSAMLGLNQFGQPAADSSARSSMLGAGAHAGSRTGQFGQPVVDSNARNSMLGTGSHPGSMASIHSPDISSFQQSQQQYPSQVDNPAPGLDPQVPPECLNVACQSLDNCIDITENGTKCCPKCIKYGCICQDPYQVYDCQANGFSDGMVPEGKSYAVAGGTTVCSCPPGGGAITCSFHDPTSSRCPEVQPNCIKTFVRELDGCEECQTVGCTSDEGVKVEAGMSMDKPPCSMCYCPPDGGNLVCGTDQACLAKQSSGLGATSQALESSVREINSMGMGGEQGRGANGFGGFNGYGGYPDYAGQYGGQDSGAGGVPVIPPVMPLGGEGGASKPGADTSASLPGAVDSQGAKTPGGGMGAYGTYNQGYGLGYQQQYGYAGGYGQGGQGYNGNYLGYGGAGTGFGPGSYDSAYGQQGAGFPQQGSSIAAAGDSKEPTPVEGGVGAGATARKDAQSQGNLGAGGYGSYYNQGQMGGYGEFGSVGQQPYAPPLNRAYSYPQTGESGDPTGAETRANPAPGDAEKAPKTGIEAVDPKTAQGYMQQAGGSQNMGYPYAGYGSQGQGGYGYNYNMYPNFGGYGQTGKAGASEFGGYANAGTRLNGQFGGSAGQNPAKAEAAPSEVSPAKDPAIVPGQSKNSRYNTGHDSNFPYYPYDQNQYASAGNPYDPSKAAHYQPVDPSLLNPSSPRAYDQGLGSPTGPLEGQARPTENHDSGTRKIRGNLSIIHKNRHSHEKALPTPATTTISTTTSTTTTTTPATTTKRPRRTRGKASAREQVSYENVLSRCCYVGRQWALVHDACTDITTPVGTYSQICAVAQEKCCLEAKEQEYCKGGIDTARSMAACDVPATLGGTCGGNEFKTCCDCCAMGLKALGLGLHCDVKIFGEPCNRAYQDCCQGGRDVPSTRRPGLPTATSRKVAPTKSPEMPEPTGPRCATDSECQQVCTDASTGMVCSCRKGYRLHDNKKDCVDVNECVLETHNCTENQFCLNREGSFICQRRISCGTGYELTQRNACEDIDECDLGIHNCFGNMDCENIRGSFRCIPKLCDTGFFTDATGRCIDIDECRSGDYICPRGATCMNTDGDYECRCPTGMEPDSSNRVCQDVDECENGKANCNEGATCINTLGSFICREPPKLRCSPGYQPNKAVTECVDIDECSEGTHTCKSGSTCINGDGGFQCQDPLTCPKGLQPDKNQRICLDIDECKDPLQQRCHAGGRCQNLPRTFRCVCDSGYVNADADDGVPTCVDVDECATSIGEKCNYKCRNTPGSYECYCPSGYKLANFGSTCEDVDECAQLEPPCGEEETCFNTYGSFSCQALSCPDGYTKITNTRSRSRCQRRSCRGKPRTCLKQPKQISFHNISLANGTKIDKPLFRMSLARSHSTDRYDFRLSAGNEDGVFKVKSSTRIKRPAGIVYTAEELVGPKDYVVDLTLKLYRQRRWSSFVSRLYIFVSKHDI